MNTRIKNTIIAALITIPGASAAGSAFAGSQTGHPEQFYDYARVKNVNPTYQNIEHRIPHEKCWTETVRTEHGTRAHSGATSTIVGGIIGGAIGNAVGHGKDNKKIGVVVGSLLGMSVGNDIGKRHRRPQHTQVSYDDVERCEVAYSTQVEERLTGYDVTYQYRGESYNTHMSQHPGDRIKVSVQIRPVVGY